MPTNVTYEYAAAEEEYHKASTNQEKLKALQKMLSTCPSHKGCEVLRAEIKTKISKLKEKLIKEKEAKKGGFSLAVKKEGAAQVVLVGPPNTGKSSLLNVLTKAKSQVGEYPFTTTKPKIGILEHQTVKIQVVDMPPIIAAGAVKQATYFAIIRNADLVLIVIDDLARLDPLLKEFQESNIILNREKPAIKIKRESTGGLEIIGEKLIQAKIDDVKKILRDNNIANATIEIFDKVTLENFFEVLDEKIAYLPALIVLNKQDKLGKTTKKGNFEIIPVSAFQGNNLELLKDKIWQYLRLIKIYTKEPGKPSIKENPITLKQGSSIKDMVKLVHKDFVRKFKYARVWGKSSKHNGASVGLDHKLADDDVVEIHLK